MRNITKIIFTNRQLSSKKIADSYIGWDGTPCGLEYKGLVQDVRMYNKQTNNDTVETIALFRRCDNGKIFYAQIIPIENSKETKWEPLPLNKIPQIIKRDIRNINLQEHKPYLHV